MKYLIKFNESESKHGRYFSFISEAEYNKHLESKDCVNFLIDEIKKIRTYVFQPLLQVQTKKMVLISQRKDKLKISRSYGEPVISGNFGRKGSLEIRKLNDDWYLIRLRSVYGYSHILCDTFKGVRQFLNKIDIASSASIFYEHLGYPWVKKMETNT